MKQGALEDSIVNDPGASFWLKEQLSNTKRRDPVDALNDAEALVLVLKERLQSMGDKPSA